MRHRVPDCQVPWHGNDIGGFCSSSSQERAGVRPEALAPLGLTHAQYAPLASLYGLSMAGQDPSQRELADYAGLEARYVSDAVVGSTWPASGREQNEATATVGVGGDHGVHGHLRYRFRD
jgi:hypothetical protein